MVAHVGLISLFSPCFPSPTRLPRLPSSKHRPFTTMAALSDDPVHEWILSEGNATQITRISPVGGGCINRANRYDTDAGSFFVKTNRSIGQSMFEGEALGLGAMYETGSIRVPKPFKFGPLPTGGSYIIMEFIEFGSFRGNQSILGRKLAEMHKAGKSEKGFGFEVDNTVGSTPQINTWSSDWIEFYGEHRLGYQLQLALDQYGDSTIYEKGQRLIKSMGSLFDNIAIEPCLLHGDLWSGNISADKNGEPVILDPACYYGHNEAEFGMSWCAGFGGSFYSSYFEILITAKIETSPMESMAEADPEPPPPPFPPPPPPQPPLSDLILSLEQATLMAKQLPCTADPTHLLHIHSSLHQAHLHLSNFLSTHKLPQPQRQNSLSSATGNEPMQVGDGDGDDDCDGFGEGDSRPTIDMVEEQMRDCFIKNKRPKRRLSPSAAAIAEERRMNDDGFVGSVKGFDPHGSKERALELVYQFHG